MNFFLSFLVGLLLLSHFVSPPVAYCQYEALPCSVSSFYCEAETTLQGTGITLPQLVQAGIPDACTNINNQNPVCPAGTSFRKEWCMCLPCYPGTYQSLAGQTTCLQTSPGRYASGIGNLATIACGINTYSLGGSGSCATCPEGTYSNQTGATSFTSCQSTIFQGSISGLAYGPMSMPGLNFGAYQFGFGIAGLPVTIVGTSTTLTSANVNRNIVVNNSITVVSNVQQSIPVTVTLPSPSSVVSGSQIHIFARNGMWRNAQNFFNFVTPNSTAQAVSNFPGSYKNSATQLVYEAGLPGADGVSILSSRRVLFPTGGMSFLALNAIGQSLLLASLNYTSGISTGGGQMLYINIAASLSTTEVSNIAWMTSYGWTVTTRRNTVVSGPDLVGKNLVFIGSGSLPTLLAAIVQGSVPILFVDSRAAVAINAASAQLTSANIILAHLRLRT